MLVATFDATTSWQGRAIRYEDDRFVCEGHGRVTAEDVLEYDRQGHLLWATAGTKSWVVAKADTERSSVVATFSPSSAWNGRLIRFEDEHFVLDAHGPITAAEVMEYDRLGHLHWASGGTRAWVGSKALAGDVAELASVTQMASKAWRRAAAAMRASLARTERSSLEK